MSKIIINTSENAQNMMCAVADFLQNAEIVINGSPRGRFEHLGVETA